MVKWHFAEVLKAWLQKFLKPLPALQSPREKRKVGRPIIYSGDPDAPDLTPQERRRIRRRIANRESARRVRAKRQDLIEEMSIKVGNPLMCCWSF